MKKIIILGGSVLQLPGIITAKQMGLYTITFDMNPSAIGKQHSDEFYPISTLDQEKVLQIATSLKVDGIMTLASDQPMKTVAFVGSKLNLNVISEKVALSTTNKGIMRNILKEKNIPIPKYRIINSLNEFMSCIRNFSLPCIIKPVDSSGSRGVQLIKSFKNLKENYLYSKRYSISGEILIEEFLEGREFSIESMTHNGITQIVAITEKETTGSPYFVEMGHFIPANISKIDEEKIVRLVKDTIRSLEIEVGPTHCELMLTDSGPIIIEIGARLGGDNITTHLVPLSTGYNIVKSTINCAIREENDQRILYTKHSMIKFIDTNQVGVIKEINGLTDIIKSPLFVDMKITKQIGEVHNGVKSSSDRIGYFILEGSSREALVDEANNLLSKISLVID